MRKLSFYVYLLPLLALGQDKEFYPIEPMHTIRYGGIFLDKLEYREKDRSLRLDLQSFYGGDYKKIWFDLEAKESLKDGKREVDRADILFGKAVSSFFDVRMGVGYAGQEDRGRARFVLDLKGLAPYWFETYLSFNLTHRGELYSKLKADYDLLLSQKLVLQPSVEAVASTHSIESLHIGKGLSKTDLSLRLRYEIRREFAPYIGFSWEKNYGQTRRIMGKREEKNLLLGLRVWF